MNYDHTHQIYGHINVSAEHSHNIGINDILRDKYLPAITAQLYDNRLHQLFLQTIKDDPLTKDKDTFMDTARKIAQERKEKREREEIEALYASYDNAETALTDSAVVAFTWAPKDIDYRYAAVFSNDKWYLTGAASPQGITTDEFIDWLVNHKLAAESVVAYVPRRREP